MSEDLLPYALSSNVPAALSSFVGREAEVRAVRAALDVHRLLTVVGAGGAGKTRLVREVAASLAALPDASNQFAAGVWWVELAPLRSGTDVPSAVAGVLGVTPSPGRQLADALVEALRPQRVLLVLDNCEHVLSETASLVETILRAAPGVTILCTSREALSVEGEVAWPIGSLRRPSVEGPRRLADVAGFEAVQLFVDRARAVTPSFALSETNAAAIVEICNRLDGLPLALELAAAVVPILGVEALAARLDDALTLLTRGRRTAISRHRTLHAVLDWSYSLLQTEERLLLRNVSVFRGSFTLDAMEEVCQSAEAPTDMVSALGRLVEHSLLELREEGGEARYRLLETVRQFGRAKLRETTTEHDVRRRHALWVARISEASETDLYSPSRGRTVQRLRQSVDEIRAALDWAAGPGGTPAIGARIAGALGWFWLSGIPWEEGRTLVTRALAAVDADGVPDTERPLDERIAVGRLFYPIEGLAYFAGDTETMLHTGARALSLWDSVDSVAVLTDAQRLASARGRSLALQLIGFAHAMRGDGAAAVRALDACVGVAARSGGAWLAAVLTMRRALVHQMIGNHTQAQADYDAALPQLRALGELWFLSHGLEGMATNALALGDATAGAQYAREAVTVLRPEPDAWFISRGLDVLAFILLSRLDEQPASQRLQDVSVAAARLVGAAEALRHRCGAAVIGPDVERQALMLTRLRTNLGDVEFAKHTAAGATLTIDDVFAEMDDDPVLSVFTTGSTEPRRAPQRVVLKTIGSFAIQRNGVPDGAERTPAGKVRELLFVLLLHDRVTKDDVGLALWPDASAAQVRNAFHVTLHHLRRQLGPGAWVVFEGNYYRLNRTPSADVTLDVDVDAVLAASAMLRAALRRQEQVDAAVLNEANRALERGTGDFASAFSGGEWIVPHQDRVRAAWADGLDALAQLYKSLNQHEDAIAALELLVAREPLRESAHRLLMATLASRGEPARALAHYSTLVDLLDREVGSRPAAETRALADRLRG